MPAEYVNKLARMFQDIKVSEDLNQEFKEMNRGSQVAGEDGREGGREVGSCERGRCEHWILSPPEMVNLKVLNAGAWSRSSERVPVSLPTEVRPHPH